MRKLSNQLSSMKYILLLLLCIKSINVQSAAILLTEKDSITNPLMFSKRFGETVYGRSAIFSSGQKKFIIGIFDSNGNDSLDIFDVVSLSEWRGNIITLFGSADQMNSNYVGKLKFIIIENNAYRTTLTALNEINIERTPINEDIKQYNFIDCLLHLSQFKTILIDSTSASIDSAKLADFNGKPTIIYYTTLYCTPCEKLKPLVTELLSSKKINLIIVSNNLDRSNKDFRTYKNRYYFDGKSDPSKVRSHGFPRVIVFDKHGQFIESDNIRNREELFRKYAFPD